MAASWRMRSWRSWAGRIPRTRKSLRSVETATREPAGLIALWPVTQQVGVLGAGPVFVPGFDPVQHKPVTHGVEVV